MHYQTGPIKELQRRNEKTADEEARIRMGKIKTTSQSYNLDSYIAKDGVIRVGRRLDKSNLNNVCKHPIVLPKCSPISKLIIAWYHKKNHAGRGMNDT